MLCEEDYRNSAEYADHWRRLNQGEAITKEFKRVGRDGRVVYLQATYTIVRNSKGQIIRS